MEKEGNINIKIDSDLLKETSEILDTLGLNFTSAITVYFEKIVTDRKIPFEISSPDYYSAEATMESDWRENLNNVEDEWK